MKSDMRDKSVRMSRRAVLGGVAAAAAASTLPAPFVLAQPAKIKIGPPAITSR